MTDTIEFDGKASGLKCLQESVERSGNSSSEWLWVWRRSAEKKDKTNKKTGFEQEVWVIEDGRGVDED